MNAWWLVLAAWAGGLYPAWKWLGHALTYTYPPAVWHRQHRTAYTAYRAYWTVLWPLHRPCWHASRHLRATELARRG